MSQIELLPELSFLAELYHADSPDACLLAEYPCSNSLETRFRNETKYIIHDPFPPPPRELLKTLGPHHLMCGWGRDLCVSSEVEPPKLLTEHWRKMFGDAGVPIWQPLDNSEKYITLFPHQSLAASKQVIDPDANYAVHSKEIIEKIDCPQADVLDKVTPPCIVKLSHGYAGLGNFMIETADDEEAMQATLAKHWPDALVVINSVVEKITGDFGVQFYLRRDGSMVWLGLTEQHFDQNKKWCGGTFSADLQRELFAPLSSMIEPTGRCLHQAGYFGLVGIDILRSGSKGDDAENFYLVDVNPRLTGISPFLMASRIFIRDEGFGEGIYQASRRFDGTLEQLIDVAEKSDDARVLVQSAFEDKSGDDAVETICHLSVTSHSQDRNQAILDSMFE